MIMWMVDPEKMCRKHLLGEHGEIHKHRHIFVKGWSIAGRKGQIEPAMMQERHDALAVELTNRGYKHNSPYSMPDLSNYDLSEFTVNIEKSTLDLMSRCPHCRENFVKSGKRGLTEEKVIASDYCIIGV